MEVLAQARAQHGGKRIPYQDLQDLVRMVDSHLSKSAKWEIEADPILVPLRELTPHHIKTGYSMEMKRCGSEETGRGFLKYLLDALAVELRVQETNPKRGEMAGDKTNHTDKTKTEKPRVLGKLYQTKGKAQRRGSESSSGEESQAPGPQRHRESSDTDNDVRNYTVVSKPRTTELPKCSCCGKGAHFLHNCYRFVYGYGPLKKRSFVEKDNRSFRCLRPGHLRAKCLGRILECRFCKSTEHHYLLCRLEDEGEDCDQGEAKVMTVQEEIKVHLQGEFSGEALGDTVTRKRATPLQMVLHVLDGNGQVVKVNAMPDTGSTHNILELEALERLGLTGHQCEYTVTGHGGHTTTHEAVCATVTVCSPDGKERYPIKFFAYQKSLQRDDPGRLESHQERMATPQKGLTFLHL